MTVIFQEQEVSPPGSCVDAPTKLQIRDLRVTFSSRGKNFVAVNGIDLEVRDGEFIAIVGPSGSGKSTFLMALDGLTPSSGGEIAVDGKVVTGPGRDRAVVFQDSCLLPWRNVLDNVSFGLEMAGMPKGERYEIARELIGLAGLTQFETFHPKQLSGGMQQRVNIARALAADPQVLLLDEPFSGLDAQTREIMQGELLKIWDERKKTAIFVTHQIDEAVFLADRVIAFSARPARIAGEWSIPFPRPRHLSIKQSPEHRALEDSIWQVVRQEGALAAA
ncbi:ABC transporter ATP-binding protein [Novosphingobium flavum]|uniref:ABC transporter ATP-binding protein n=1 Tax=Novosphingobium flavum TaxID=1778672 RepID=A0A7X1FUH2_9SPHN|nr:ABC transporter ATP-binding protein [Novosphingobium flavum]MBC2666647.1 ABC transporter ATP-binding protein [Novosphingobium flavum]